VGNSVAAGEGGGVDAAFDFASVIRLLVVAAPGEGDRRATAFCTCLRGGGGVGDAIGWPGAATSEGTDPVVVVVVVVVVAGDGSSSCPVNNRTGAVTT
jgi:hypothetical protein